MESLSTQIWLRCAHQPQRADTQDQFVQRAIAGLLEARLLRRFIAHDGVPWIDACIPHSLPRRELEPAPKSVFVEGIDIDAVHYRFGAVAGSPSSRQEV